jgi:hypothetical protein
MKIIPDWRSAWRWFSVQALAALVALPLVWVGLPPDVKSFLPDGAEPYILVLLAAGGLVGRLVDQKKAPAA